MINSHVNIVEKKAVILLIQPQNLHLKIRHTVKSARGAITILMALVMLGLALTSAIYTAKSKILDIRIANAELRKNQAISSAETGIDRAIAQLDVQPQTADSTITETINSSDYVITFTEMLDGSGVPMFDPSFEAGNDFLNRIVEISSLGYSDSSDSQTGTRTVELKVFIRSVARGAPDSAITVAGSIGIGGAFTVGANPNGGGQGVPLSVWSSDAVDLTGNGATCALQEFDLGICDDSPYSDSTAEAGDVFEDSLVSDGGSFPNDLLEYTFGVATADYQSLKDQADEVYSNCAPLAALGAAAHGLYWIEGDCSINANNVIGSIDEPVIIVIEDADVTLNGGAIINGLVFSFETAPGNGGDVSMVGGATIRGAFISDHDIDISSGTFNTRFDAEVLGNISNPDGAEFSKVEIIPGSWKDF